MWRTRAGRWLATPEQLDHVEGDGLVVFRYCERSGVLSDAANPNGATNHIALLNHPGVYAKLREWLR